MLKSYSLFKTEDEVNPASIESDHDFNVVEVLWASSPQEKNGALYSQLVYKVQRDPNHLISHVQRIYYAYNHRMKDQLYAAFVDLFLVLGKGGSDLCNRLLAQTRSVLSKQYYQILVWYLEIHDAELLVGNKYTVLTGGALKYSISSIEDENLEASY